MNVLETSLPGVLVIEPAVHRDSRGFLLETFQQERYARSGIRGPFVQDNHSHSIHGTLRGLHAQSPHPQGKLVRVIEGEIFDVAVDIRRGSPTFGRWVGTTLSSGNHQQLFVPPGLEGRYRTEDMKLPEDYLPQHPFDHGNYTGRDEALLELVRWRVRHDVAFKETPQADASPARFMRQLQARGALREAFFETRYDIEGVVRIAPPA